MLFECPKPNILNLLWLDLLAFAANCNVEGVDDIVDRFCTPTAPSHAPRIDVNKQTADGNTALHMAATGGDLRIVEKLVVVAKARVDLRNRDDCTPLHLAKKTAVAALLLPGSNRKGFVNAPDVNGRTPLHYAARSSQDGSLIRFLLEQGAVLNARDASGASPLSFAVLGANKKIVKLLLELRANPNFEGGENQETPLHAAVAMASELVVDIDGRSSSSSHEADIVDIFGLLLQAGALTSSTDCHGNTPLHLAAASNNLKFCQALLRVGASPFLKNHAKKTALDVASGPRIRALLDVYMLSGVADQTSAGAARLAHPVDATTAQHLAERCSQLTDEIDRLRAVVTAKDGQIRDLQGRIEDLVNPRPHLLAPDALDNAILIHQNALSILHEHQHPQ